MLTFVCNLRLCTNLTKRIGCPRDARTHKQNEGATMETIRPHRALALLACSSMACSGAVAQSQTQTQSEGQGQVKPPARSANQGQGKASSAGNPNKRIEALQHQVV